MIFAGSDSARDLSRKVLGDLDRRKRQRLRFLHSPRASATPTIYFLAPDYEVPSGGTMVLYRHIDILNAAGFSAAALHQRSGFRYTWFDNDTRTADLASTRLGPGDVVVFPETDIDLINRLPPGIGYVIFNQNSHLTWQRSNAVADAYRKNRAGFLGVVTVSAHNQTMLRQAFGDIEIARVHLGIDAQRFWSPPGDRPRRITYMPRRGRADAELTLSILKQRGLLEGWEVVPLTGLRHDQVAQQLRRSTIFLSFTYQEGFGLPAAEAMACGNHVIGYHGWAGQEFFDPRFSTPVATGDVTAFVCAVEQVLVNEASEVGWCLGKGRQASDFILTEYAQEREREDVAAIYSRLCGLLDTAMRPDHGILA